MEDRVQSIESRVRVLENMVFNSSKAPNNYAVLENLKWIFVDFREVTDDIVDMIINLYLGRNFEGFKEHILTQFPASLYLLCESGNVNLLHAAIIVKSHPCGQQIKLNVVKNKVLVSSHISKKYHQLLSCKRHFFCELGSGVLQSELRKMGLVNETNVRVITFVSQVGIGRIIRNEDDLKKRCSNGPCELNIGSYFTNSGKVMNLFGIADVPNSSM